MAGTGGSKKARIARLPPGVPVCTSKYPDSTPLACATDAASASFVELVASSKRPCLEEYLLDGAAAFSTVDALSDGDFR